MDTKYWMLRMDLDKKKGDSCKANKANEDKEPGKHRNTKRHLKKTTFERIYIPLIEKCFTALYLK